MPTQTKHKDHYEKSKTQKTNEEMKKLLLFVLLIFSTSILFANNANDGKKKFDNVVVTSHGNYYEIVDNEKNVCTYIRIEQDSNGLYNLMCENKLTKRLTKKALKAAIHTALVSLIPNTYGLSALFIEVAPDIADYLYDEACEYFE